MIFRSPLRFWAVVLLLAGMMGCQSNEAMPPEPEQADQPGEAPRPAEMRLRLIGTQAIPSGAAVDVPYRGTTRQLPVGGLSGLDYAPNDSTWYVVSDGSEQAVPPRFFSFKLKFDRRGFRKATVTGVTLLKTSDDTVFVKNGADAESIRYHPDSETLYWLNEGQESEKIQPFLYEMNVDGTYIREVPLPSVLKFSKRDTLGLRRNRAMEGMALTPEGDALWVANEEPLLQDGPPAQPDSSTISPIRLTKLDLQTGQLEGQYAYMLDPVPARPVPPSTTAINGVSEILALSNGKLLVVERAFVLGPGFFTRVFEVDIASATDISDAEALKRTKYTPVSKALLLEFSSLDGIGPLDLNNTEGVALGPTLDNGNPSIVFVTDNNFNPLLSSQFFVFELRLPSEDRLLAG